MIEAPVASPKSSVRWWQGFGLVLLATLALSLQNVLARIAQSSKSLDILGGLLQLGGYVEPTADKLQVSLLVLLLRISFVIPILWLLLPVIKSGAWQEARQVVTGSDQKLKWKILLAGFFLFLSQTSIYFSISNVGPATAVTIFFIYPTVTTLLAWKIFGDRPTWQKWAAIVLIYIGCTWLAFSAPNATFNANFWGITSAVLSGIVFAMEGIIAQSCFKKVNPATFTGLIFAVEWLFLLVVHLLLSATSDNSIPINGGLMLMGALLSLATLSGYLFNNFGIRAIGAASTAVIGSSGPAVTSVLSLLILGDLLTGGQWSAILLVTFGVLLMNLARLQVQPAED
jgi:drug/metabolite transporter (DMT)-like permease